MTTPAKMTAHISRPEKGRVPSSLVILLHGLGADGRDLLGLSGPWRDFLPDTVFVAPDAPFACDMAPYGHQWFSLRDWSPRAIRAGVEKTAPILDAFISAQCVEYNIPPARTALVGFSQGTMMALYVAPRHKEKLAGVLGYSGGLVGGEDLAANAQFHRLPVCLIHGEADDVVPVAAYTLARRTLEAAGFPVSGHTTPGLPHSIDDAGIETGGEFLKENLER